MTELDAALAWADRLEMRRLGTYGDDWMRYVSTIDRYSVTLARAVRELREKLRACPTCEERCAERIAKAESELAALKGRYEELVLAVAQKWPDETRHQTALRYIQEAETPKGGEMAAKEQP